MTPVRKVRVVVIDHMPLSRKAVAESVGGSAIVEIVGVASSPRPAIRKLDALKPDVILLDLEDASAEELSLLVPLAREVQVPIVLFTALDAAARRMVMTTLGIDADRVIEKPLSNLIAGIFEIAPVLEATLKRVHTGERLRWPGPVTAEPARIVARPAARPAPPSPPPPPPPPQRNLLPSATPARSSQRIIAIGASTGGTEVIADLLTRLPTDMPGIVIVQHMPQEFTGKFAERLDQLSPLSIKEAEDGDRILQGAVLIAPGGHQLRVTRQGDGFVVRVQETTRVSGHCPSVDVLLSSVAKAAGARGIGVVLTGMGKDGAQGLLEMRQAGGRTFAQDKASSTVFGMPAEAERMGGAEKVVSAADLPRQLSLVAYS